MIKMEVSGKEYIVQYGMNSFCDSDILDKVEEMLTLFSDNNAKSDKDVSGLGKIKDLFCITRELIFIGFEKKNPLANLKEAGDLLDDYREEAPEGEERSLMSIFAVLSEELLSKGFLSDLLNTETPSKPKRTSKR